MMQKKDLLTFSNLLSIFRLLLAIPFWILLNNFDQQSIRYITAGLCLFAALTDVFDGYFARKFNQVSEMGKIVDPLADKVVIAVLIVKLYLIGEIPGYYFILIVARDILILIGGIIVSKKIGKVIPSNAIGKITVIFISLVILFIILNMDRATIFFLSFWYSSIVLIGVSFIVYLLNAIKEIKLSNN